MSDKIYMLSQWSHFEIEIFVFCHRNGPIVPHLALDFSLLQCAVARVHIFFVNFGREAGSETPVIELFCGRSESYLVK